MTTLAYYNENDPKAAAWLHELISRGHIAPGYVDERDIRDVRPVDLRPYTRCHFFAGIGGWDYALSLADWPEDAPVWTGSCPCQPFSAAGRRGGAEDARHLWPEWWRLIADCQPPVVFGEQVASRDGRLWLTAVRADLEALGYAVGATDLCAAGVGAPHIRQRAWFVADAKYTERGSVGVDRQDVSDGGDVGRSEAYGESGACGEIRRMADPMLTRWSERWPVAGDGSTAWNGIVGDTERKRREGGNENGARSSQFGSTRSNGGGWDHADFIPFGDGKMRPVEPGTFPLAHGVPARVGRLRGYGNAIVPQVAAKFIRAYRGVMR